jgi:hypothetical protein
MMPSLTKWRTGVQTETSKRVMTYFGNHHWIATMKNTELGAETETNELLASVWPFMAAAPVLELQVETTAQIPRLIGCGIRVRRETMAPVMICISKPPLIPPIDTSVTAVG